MHFKTGTTDKQKIKALNKQIDLMQNRIDNLKSMLAEKEINPLDYEQLGNLSMKYHQALMIIKITHNPATKAWELADSALKDE